MNPRTSHLAQITLLVATAALWQACSDSVDAPLPQCAASADCEAGLACVDGACVPSSDGSDGDAPDASALPDAPLATDTVLDAGSDAAQDAEVPHDASLADTPDMTEDVGGLPDVDAAPDVEDVTADAGVEEVSLPPLDVTSGPAKCENDSDCQGLQRCDDSTGTGLCSEPPICLDSGDCFSGRVCDRGHCADTWAGCESDADCPKGACALTSHTCADALPCASDGDCVGDRVCKEGACVECKGPSDCPSSAMGCADGLCIEPDTCTADLDCLEGGQCTEGACQQLVLPDDAFENNDVPTAAAPLPSGVQSGLTIQSWDDDWFRVTVPKGRGVLVRVTFDDAHGDLDVTLLEATGSHILSVDARALDYAVVGTGPLVTEQVVLVHVINTTGTVPSYDIEVWQPQEPFCVPDALDAEGSNDSPTNASPLSGAEVALVGMGICAGEADWYSLKTFSTGTMSAAIQYPHALGDLDVLLFDEDLGPMGASGAPGSFEFASAADLPPGTYYVKVVGASPDVHNGYALTIKTVTSAACQFDSYEVNDTAAAAAAFSGIDLQLTLCPDEEDWYATEVPSGMGLLASLQYSNYNAQLGLEVHELVGEQTTHLISADYGATFPKGLVSQDAAYEQAPKTKTILTRVYRVDSEPATQFTPYSLDVEVVPGFCIDDAKEPDSTWDLAVPLKTIWGQTNPGKLCAGDPGDFYAVDLDGDSVLTLDLIHPVDEAPLSLTLFQPDGLTPISLPAKFFNNIGKYVVFDVSQMGSMSGTCYVRVSGSTSTSYVLTGTVANKGQCPVDDTLEPNDSVLSSTPLVVGSTVTPYFCPNNPDVFHVQSGSGNALTVSLTIAPELQKTIVQLFGPDFTALYSEAVSESKDISLTDAINASGQSGVFFVTLRSPFKGSYAIKLTNTP